MPIHRPRELRAFLDQLGIRPKRKLSQNFLIDGNIIRKIVQAASIQPRDVVLEIGPGAGALTEGLLEAGAKVVAVEKDQVLAHALSRFSSSGSLIVYEKDILDFSIEEEMAKVIVSGKKGKVVANLPYHLTLPILSTLLPLSGLFSEIVVMVQNEVTDRYLAPVGSLQYGYFNVFLKLYSNLKKIAHVSKNCFYPSPGVDSALLHFELKETPLGIDVTKFLEMVKKAFAQRRKKLSGALRSLYSLEKIENALTTLGKSSQERGENLSLEEFIALYRYL